MDDVNLVRSLRPCGFQLVPADDIRVLDGTVENGEVHIKRTVCDLFCHGSKRRNTRAARQAHQILRIPQGLVEKVGKRQVADELLSDRRLFKKVVRNEVGAVLADRDFEIRLVRSTVFVRGERNMLSGSGLTGGTGNGIGPRQNAFADLKMHVHILAGLKYRNMAVRRLESEGLRSRGGVIDLRQGIFPGTRMGCISERPDGVDGVRLCGRIIDGGFACLGYTAGAADIGKKSFDFHFAAPPFSMARATNFAAALPFVTAGPMPLPLMPAAQANSRPSITWSSSRICRRATAWFSMLWRLP